MRLNYLIAVGIAVGNQLEVMRGELPNGYLRIDSVLDLDSRGAHVHFDDDLLDRGREEARLLLRAVVDEYFVLPQVFLLLIAPDDRGYLPCYLLS